MDSDIFVEALKTITTSALSGLLKTIEKPPGRKPDTSLIRISDLFHRLSENDKQTFSEALQLAARQSTNNFLLVLDGSLAIESVPEKGALELYYKNERGRTRLNDPADAPLNEIFRRTE